MLTKIKNFFCKHKSTYQRLSEGFIDHSGVKYYGTFITHNCEKCRKVLGETKFVRVGE